MIRTGSDSNNWRDQTRERPSVGFTGLFNKKKHNKNSHRKKNTTYRERISLGIACCRFNGDRAEILVVRKRYTYAYCLFVQGKYKSDNDAELINLFNGMTVEEKLDIQSLNFTQIWYRIWLDSIRARNIYFFAKNKFESTFLADNGIRLKRLISKSSHAETIWEIPKGRKNNKNESDIHTAVREFREETGITKKQYRICRGANRTYSYIDDGIRYTNLYYFAYCTSNINPKIDFRLPDQVCEICDIRWMDIEMIKFADTTGRLVNTVKPIFKYMYANVKK